MTSAAANRICIGVGAVDAGCWEDSAGASSKPSRHAVEKRREIISVYVGMNAVSAAPSALGRPVDDEGLAERTGMRRDNDICDLYQGSSAPRTHDVGCAMAAVCGDERPNRKNDKTGREDWYERRLHDATAWNPPDEPLCDRHESGKRADEWPHAFAGRAPVRVDLCAELILGQHPGYQPCGALTPTFACERVP